MLYRVRGQNSTSPKTTPEEPQRRDCAKYSKTRSHVAASLVVVCQQLRLRQIARPERGEEKWHIAGDPGRRCVTQMVQATLINTTNDDNLATACRVCGHKLTNLKSRQAGMGAICAAKVAKEVARGQVDLETAIETERARRELVRDLMTCGMSRTEAAQVASSGHDIRTYHHREFGDLVLDMTAHEVLRSSLDTSAIFAHEWIDPSITPMEHALTDVVDAVCDSRDYADQDI